MTLWDPRLIIAAVANAFGISTAAVTEGRRGQHRTTARMVAAYVMRESGAYSYPDIARALSYRDHTSARHAVLVIGLRLHTDPQLHLVIAHVQSVITPKEG